MGFLSKLFGKRPNTNTVDPRVETLAALRRRVHDAILEQVDGELRGTLDENDPAKFQIDSDTSGESLQTDVTYLFAQISNLDASEMDRADAMIQNMVETAKCHINPTTDETLPEQLVVVLRPIDYLLPIDPIETVEQPIGRKLVSRPFGGDLVQIVAKNNPTSLEMLTQDALSSMSISEEQAWETAFKNVFECMGKITQKSYPDLGGLMTLTSAEDLISALLTQPIKESGYCAALVQRNLIALADISNNAAMEGLYRLVGRSIGTDDFYSNTIVRYDGEFTISQLAPLS